MDPYEASLDEALDTLVPFVLESTIVELGTDRDDEVSNFAFHNRMFGLCQIKSTRRHCVLLDGLTERFTSGLFNASFTRTQLSHRFRFRIVLLLNYHVDFVSDFFLYLISICILYIVPFDSARLEGG